MKVWLEPEMMEKAAGQGKEIAEVIPKGDFVPRLHLRGKYREDILPMLERFIYDAVCYDIKQVTIVHGKGQGILRRAVAEFLKGNRQVASFRLGGTGEGGDGVTIAELK